MNLESLVKAPNEEEHPCRAYVSSSRVRPTKSARHDLFLRMLLLSWGGSTGRSTNIHAAVGFMSRYTGYPWNLIRIVRKGVRTIF